MSKSYKINGETVVLSDSEVEIALEVVYNGLDDAIKSMRICPNKPLSPDVAAVVDLVREDVLSSWSLEDVLVDWISATLDDLAIPVRRDDADEVIRRAQSAIDEYLSKSAANRRQMS